MNYTFTYILCILRYLFYIYVFHKINNIYRKTIHFIFFKSQHKIERSFFFSQKNVLESEYLPKKIVQHTDQ